MTSNMVECFNNVLKGVRSLLVTAIVKYTFFKLNEYFLRHSEETAKWIVDSHPDKKKLLSVQGFDFFRYAEILVHFMIAPLWPADPNGWYSPRGDDYVDMASYHGKIFTVTHSGKLFSHDLVHHGCEHVMKMSPSIQPVNNTVCHLVVSVSADKEKLLMVRWSRKAMCVMVDDQRRAMNLQVFEAGLAEGQWLEVKDLGGQVLFLSRSCCRAFGSPEQCYPRFPQGNRVYILGVDWHLKRTVAGASPCKCHDCQHVGVPSYCVYDMTTHTVKRQVGVALSMWVIQIQRDKSY
ncbi:uncharacterized protein [Triticum aestivum]|uniref:uncharacterized protein n=1 Tax=Triticum aestivum TaxID=4565 RepID=UPI001D028AB6|nr:uncharacterized protein LOC123171356 [Triticum aestivum]